MSLLADVQHIDANAAYHPSFAGIETRDRIRVRMRDGLVHDGAYMSVAGMAFLLTRMPGDLLDTTIGPLSADLVDSVEVIKAWASISSDRHHQSRGERFPGAEPVTALDFEYRLQRLARTIGSEVNIERKAQLVRQFDDLADRISLASGKRAWVRAEGRWSQTSNAPPSLKDLWQADVASPSFMARPRPQDFDPDPAVRRRRTIVPAEVMADPHSIPNVYRALRRAGLKARIALAGDPVWRRAEIQVDLRDGRKGRFYASAKPAGDRTLWRLAWGGNEGATATRQRISAQRLPEYRTLVALIPTGALAS